MKHKLVSSLIVTICYIIFVGLMFVGASIQSQNTYTVSRADTAGILFNPADSIICAERGHVWSSFGITTAAYCPPYIEDNEDYSLKVYPNCNITTSTCERCGKEVSGSGDPKVEVLWERYPGAASADERVARQISRSLERLDSILNEQF